MDNSWRAHLRADPLGWLLATDTPEVRAARAAAMAVDPIRSMLAAQDPAGWWAKPGPGL